MSHECPRPGCTRAVDDDQYACRGDWYALPEEIRTRIWRTWRADNFPGHVAAMSQAAQWYRENPRGGTA